MRAGLAVGLAIVGGLLACNPPVDYGQPCRLTRGSDGGVEVIPATDASVSGSNASNFDFLANGDPDCEDLVCVRQAGKDFSQLDADGNAHGICSTPCIDDTDCGDPANGLTCSQLAFDPQFIQNLCANDPVTCEQYFGDTRSADFCIDPNLPNLSSTGNPDGGA